MPPRRVSPRRASEGSTASTISQSGKELAGTVGATATRAWQNPLMRNAFLGIAAVVGALAIMMGFWMNPAYPVPPKGVVLVTGQWRLGGLGREGTEISTTVSGPCCTYELTMQGRKWPNFMQNMIVTSH